MSIVDSYNKVVANLREKLLSLSHEEQTPQLVVRDIFSRIDNNKSGFVTLDELQQFFLDPQLQLLSAEDPRCETFSRMLLEQIDSNADHEVSLSELEHFLFPESSSISEATAKNEPGAVLELVRQAIRAKVSVVAAADSDELLLAEFAKLSSVRTHCQRNPN
jgi:Ca2+-binding EF-hand superfamily protein